MDNIAAMLDAVCLAAQIIVESGGETYRAEETVERMCQGANVPHVDVVALPTGLMLTLTAENGEHHTRIVRMHRRATDLTRIDQCNGISRRVAAGEMSVEDSLEALRRIRRQPSPSWPMLIGASALSAACFTAMLGGSMLDFLISVFCGAVLQLVQIPLSSRRVPSMLLGLVSGTLVTLVALLATRVFAEIHIEPIISGAIMPLIPGLATANGIRDTMRGDLVSGGARVMEAILCAMMLAAGIGLTLSMWGGSGL